MSCRETHGNSAATSLAKFVSGADEQTVSRLFHQLRREAGDTLGDQATQPADPAAVSTFIAAGMLTAATDPRIRDSRRESLRRRFEAALVDVAEGRGPNKATFQAWTSLDGALADLPDQLSIDDRAIDPTIGTTADGLTISLGDVLAAHRRAEEARLDRNRATSPYVNLREHDQDTTPDALAERARRLEAAYDATDAGFLRLSGLPESDPTHPDHEPWRARHRAAIEARGTTNRVLALREQAEQIGPDAARAARETALSAVRDAEDAYKAQPSDTARIAYENAGRELSKAQRIYLYAITDQQIRDTIGQDMRSATLWSMLADTGTARRVDRWRAAELACADRDTAEVTIGRITTSEANRRAHIRAEARQALLDSEGHGGIDPINRRFADAVRLRRGDPRTAVAS